MFTRMAIQPFFGNKVPVGMKLYLFFHIKLDLGRNLIFFFDIKFCSDWSANLVLKEHKAPVGLNYSKYLRLIICNCLEQQIGFYMLVLYFLREFFSGQDLV